MLLPFLSLPYMLRIIGASYYGSYSYVYALIQYMLLITSYGFLYSATKQVSQNRDNPESIHKIYSSVTIAKCILLIVCVLIFFLLGPFLLHNSDEKKMLMWGLGIVIGDILMPTYLYQGLERMRYLTIIDLIPKLLFTVLIFIIVKEPKDYKNIIILNSAGYICAGIFSTLIARYTLKSRFRIITIFDIKYQLKEGFAIFGSTIGINLYRNSNIVLLGWFCSDTVVGIYAGADKIVKAVQSIVSPLTQALFPHVSYLFRNIGSTEKIKYILKISLKSLILLIPVTLILYIFAPIISGIILGENFVKSIELIKIMSIVIIIGGLNYILGIIGLINLNYGKFFMLYVLLSGIISIIFSIMFIREHTYYATSISMVIAEAILLICCLSKIMSMKNAIH